MSGRSKIRFLMAVVLGGAVSVSCAETQPTPIQLAAAAKTKRPAKPSPTPAPTPVVVAPKPAAVATAGGANQFNRLMLPAAQSNLPPAQDGIHDAAVDGTAVLMAPKDGFAGMPPLLSGNRVNWVKALKDGKIAPRYERADATAEAVTMDLDIVREVKGRMPDVVFPHQQHTEWLDCANCHPAIFEPAKGANQMSMAAILLGQSCGVCHGKVAFPVSECRLCHSKPKPAVAARP